MVPSIFTDSHNANSQFYNIFITSKITLYPHSLPSLPCHSPKQPQIYFVSIDLPVLDILHK